MSEFISVYRLDRSIQKMDNEKAEAGREMTNLYIVMDTAIEVKSAEYYKHRVTQGRKSRQIEMSERGVLDILHSMQQSSGTPLNKLAKNKQTRIWWIGKGQRGDGER